MSSTAARSSAEWISRAASSGSIARIGKNPYATVPNFWRTQWLSVKPATHTGTAFAPGSDASTQELTASHSGVSSSERVPPYGCAPGEVVVTVAERLADQRLGVLRCSGPGEDGNPR